MPVTNHSAWTDYKATLVRIALAGARLTEAQTRNRAILDAAEREFFDALRAYDVARGRLGPVVAGTREGVVIPFSSKSVCPTHPDTH
jgi:hypothetical protein